MHLYLLRLPSLAPHLRQDHPRNSLACRRITALILALLPASPRHFLLALVALPGGGPAVAHQPIPLLFHSPVPLLPVCLPLQCPRSAKTRWRKAWYSLLYAKLDLSWHHLQNLRNLRVQYEIQLPNGNRVSTDVEDHRLPHHLSYPADEMVGVEQERTMMMNWLKTCSTSVITVWGMGGSGKTTLVNSIYEDERIKNQFDCHIWITVSQKFNASDIMRKMVRHMLQRCPPNIDSIDGRDLASTVERSNNNGNKVVITTRIKEVASLASEDQVLQLQKLNDADSWCLFCRWAFKNHIDRSCPQELESLGREIMAKCDGLPLAIVVVGNMLSFKKQDMEEWSKCNDQLTWELRDRLRDQELSSVMKILKLSYKNLPSHLKNAFVFCSI